MDVVALRTPKMRGQAHVVFKDVASSTAALRALQGFTMYEKDIKVAYAQSKSHILAKLDGTFTLPDPKDAVDHTVEGGKSAVAVGQKRQRESDSGMFFYLYLNRC